MLYNNLFVNEEGHLTFSGYDTVALAEQFGTPLMVMDEDLIRSHGAMSLYTVRWICRYLFRHCFPVILG